MNKKEAKIEALRIAVADINAASGQIDFEGAYTHNEEEKIRKEMNKIANSLYKQAARLGGDFNEFTGFTQDTIIKL